MKITHCIVGLVHIYIIIHTLRLSVLVYLSRCLGVDNVPINHHRDILASVWQFIGQCLLLSDLPHINIYYSVYCDGVYLYLLECIDGFTGVTGF